MQLTKAYKELLIKRPFYGLFLLNLRKNIISEKHEVTTAAVDTDGINFALYINKDFWDQLTDTEQLAVLTHEVMHICFFHLTDAFKASNHYLMNIATDLSINQFIVGLPTGCVTLDGISKLIGKNLEPKRGAWYYYDEICKFAKDHPEKCIPGSGGISDFRSIDNHSMWPEKISEAERKLYENQIKAQLKECTDTVSKFAGTIPGELTDILKEIKNNPPIFNWKKYFRRIVGNVITNNIVLTRMRPSKRIPDSLGIKFKRNPNICVIVDTSGSIKMKNFEEFFSEIDHIHKTGVNITVVECDTKITNIFEYKKFKNIEFKGRGGTDMTEAIQYYKEHGNFSSCILFTDGYLSTFNLPLCHNLIWVITSNGNKSQKYPGKTIFIP